MLVSLKKISMIYGNDNKGVMALRDINLEVKEGDFLAVSGKSGCGKSTLLNVLGVVCKPSRGTYFYNDRAVTDLNDAKRADFRCYNVGFVVQHFALIKDMTVFQSISLPLRYQGKSRKYIKERVEMLADQFDISDKLNTVSGELSGGQCQRVAIARAISGNPKLLLADEPTGALDEETGEHIINIFRKLNQGGMTIVMVTHDVDIAQQCRRQVIMKDGGICQCGK